jgi:DNA-binding transcriptional LysR family regulator
MAMEFADLQTFVHAATLGGLTRAADRMGLSKSIISRRLAKLEAELGARLLTRSTRGISLTEAGDDFLVYAERILAEMDDARAVVASRDGELAGRLRLAAPLSFGTEHLAPAVAEFASQHPRLSIDVSYGDHVHDIVAEGFDAAVRIGSLANSTLVARRIAPMRAIVAASPDYLERRGSPKIPQDLASHEALIYTGFRDPGMWIFDGNPKAFGVRVTGRIRANNGEALRAAAIAGHGIGIFPAFMIHHQLRAGALVAILADYPLPTVGLNLVRAPGPASAKFSIFATFLLERFGGKQPWDTVGAQDTRSF